jgi:transcriptional/translational regulatory protein YebC/TACO1
MFKRKGQIFIEEERATEEQLMDVCLEAGADDIQNSDGQWEVLAPMEAYQSVIDALQKAGIATVSAELAYVPENLVKLEGAQARAMLKMHEALDDHDDVQNVYSNFDVDEDELDSME